VLGWIDLEMTGLDPTRHRIVEIATLLTDDDLEVVAIGPDLVVHATPSELARMDAVVREMHTRSGLLAAIQASTVDLATAAAETRAFLERHVGAPAKIPLCGNSIGTDRRFLAAQMPAVDAFFHYRSIDVSSVKELARRWLPVTYGKAPRKAKGHRALDDITESVAELAYYRENLFVPEARRLRSASPTPSADPTPPTSPA
jgi:oligoribonuclease